MIRYAARFYLGEDGWYMAEVPALKPAMTQGQSPEEIRMMASELVGALLAHRVWGKMPGPVPPNDEKLPRGEGWDWVYPPTTTVMAIEIRQLRDAAGLSMAEAAERIGVSSGTYQRWEHPEKCNARVDTLEKIAKAFGRHFVGSFVA